MKTRDLLAGCSVTITPHDDVRLVSLSTDSLKTVTMRTYPTTLAETVERDELRTWFERERGSLE